MSSLGEDSRLEKIYSEILHHFDKGDDDQIISKTQEKEIQSWLRWFTAVHPNMEPLDVLSKTEGTPDFRVFFLAYPTPGYALMRVLEAYHHVDKALCGTSAPALERVKKMWGINQLEYLSSEDSSLWWETSLCELNDAIELGDSRNLRVDLQFNRVTSGATWLESLASDLDEDCWLPLREDSDLGEFVPDILESVEAGIYERASLLNRSAETLTKTLANAESNSSTQNQTDKAEKLSLDFRGQHRVNEGIRRRVPFAGSSSDTSSTVSGMNLPDSDSVTIDQLPESHGEVCITASVESALWSSLKILIPQTTVVALVTRLLATLKDTMSTNAGSLKHQSVMSRMLSFMIHKSTALILFAIFILVGGASALLSTHESQQQTSGFSVAISQMSFSLLSVYLTVLPPLRSRSLHLRYPLWFWSCMLLSGLTCVLSTSLYFRANGAATLLGCVSSFAQVVCSLLLVECVEDAVKAGSIGGVE